jgi:hypothetical protein
MFPPRSAPACAERIPHELAPPRTVVLARPESLRNAFATKFFTNNVAHYAETGRLYEMDAAVERDFFSVG